MDLAQMGQRIKQERKRRHLTLEEFSEQVGISRNFLWEIEAGRKAPALQTLYHLSEQLGVSADYLLGLSAAALPGVGAGGGIIEQILKRLSENSDRENQLLLELLAVYQQSR